MLRTSFKNREKRRPSILRLVNHFWSEKLGFAADVVKKQTGKLILFPVSGEDVLGWTSEVPGWRGLTHRSYATLRTAFLSYARAFLGGLEGQKPSFTWGWKVISDFCS